MKIRKQVYDLGLQDLEKASVWEFASDEESEEGQDEATVRPIKVSGCLDPSEGTFIVRAAFTFADGSKADGYLTPSAQGDESLSSVQPVVVTDFGQVCFWYGVIAPSQQHLKQFYRILGKQPDRVFPLSFQSQTELIGGHVSGSIPGFLVLEDWRSGKTRVVQ